MKLELKKTDKENVLVGQRKNGKSYSVRKDRRRYFFPDEWLDFIGQFTNKKHKFFFNTLLHTGGRIMEVLNLRYQDIDIERETINFKVVKQRKAKRNFNSSAKTRGFFIAENFIKEYKSYIRNRKINTSDYIFLDNDKLPANYNDLDNKDRREFFHVKFVAYSNLLKRKLRKTKIPDPENFSPHNIRKTYGMWMRTYDKEMSELCYRMGHDLDTYMNHYGSSLIFTQEERRKIAKIFGEVK